MIIFFYVFFLPRVAQSALEGLPQRVAEIATAPAGQQVAQAELAPCVLP